MVEVEEHEALGTWGNADSSRLINTYGEVFSSPTRRKPRKMAQLLALDGPPDSEGDVVDKLETMRGMVQARSRSSHSTVTLSSRRASAHQIVQPHGGGAGREQNDEERDAMAQARQAISVVAWPQVTEQWGKQIEYADLRYPNGFAIRAANVRFLTDAQAAAAAKRNPPAPARIQVRVQVPTPIRITIRRDSRVRTRRKPMSKEYKDLLVGLDIGTSAWPQKVA
ncbi:cell division protein FtsQ/DivIB, partial [Cupriavidus basilensis]